MATRTNRLIGAVWGDPNNPATISVSWNNQEVFSGAVTTLEFDSLASTNTPQSLVTLCEWSTDSEEAGTFPVSVTVNNGVLALNNIHSNHLINKYQRSVKPDAVWPASVPQDFYEVIRDFVAMSDQELQTKYGLSRTEIASNFDQVLEISKEDYFASSYVEETDGENKSNVRINGTTRAKNAEDYPDRTGIWTFMVPDQGTIDFDFFVGTSQP